MFRQFIGFLCARKLQLLSLLLSHHASIHDFERVYDFLRMIYIQSKKLFFDNPELINLCNPRIKENFSNLLVSFQAFCSQLQKKTASKNQLEAKKQPFQYEEEANEFLLKLKSVSTFLQKPESRLVRCVSCSQLNIFQERSKRKEHVLPRSLSSDIGCSRSSKRI